MAIDSARAADRSGYEAGSHDGQVGTQLGAVDEVEDDAGRARGAAPVRSAMRAAGIGTSPRSVSADSSSHSRDRSVSVSAASAGGSARSTSVRDPADDVAVKLAITRL